MVRFNLELEGRPEKAVGDFSDVVAALNELCGDEPSYVILSKAAEEYIQCAVLDDGSITVEVRLEEGKRHYRCDTEDVAELKEFFHHYYEGKLELHSWVDVTKEMVPQPIVFEQSLQQTAHGCEPYSSRQRAFAAKQLMRIVDLLSGGNGHAREEMNRNLQDAALAEQAEALSEQSPICVGVLAEMEYAAWLPPGFSIQRDDLKWTCMQWRKMISILSQLGLIVYLQKRKEDQVEAFKSMLDELMRRKEICLDYHNAYFNTRKNSYLTAWACVADGVLESDAGVKLCMLGALPEQYPFILIDQKDAAELWKLSFSIGLRACTLREYSFFSYGSMRITADAGERINLWKSTGFLQEEEG